MPSLNITDFGAVGDGTTDNAAAVQRTIDECHSSGGGRVIVPAAHLEQTEAIQITPVEGPSA